MVTGREFAGLSPLSTWLFQAFGMPVTAVAALRLVEQGKLNLDADVSQYLRSWKLPTNRFTEQKKVTLRELLSHTAGATVRLELWTTPSPMRIRIWQRREQYRINHAENRGIRADSQGKRDHSDYRESPRFAQQA